MPITLNGDTGIVTPMYNGTITANAVTPSVNMKNRIINGAMVIDQRNAGASVTLPDSVTYTLDRWYVYSSQASKLSCQQNAGSVTPPVGFTKYLGMTSLSAYSVGSGEVFWLNQAVEGLNATDLAWGTANAKTVTLSFWVRSSLTGTFGGSIRNGAGNRSYPFSFTINSANTWEFETITIAGDTSGTWVTDNSAFCYVTFSMGAGSTFSGTANTWQAGNLAQPTGATSVVGTNGATFYITGVQLEVGSTATSFDYRPYGTELNLCQRYLNQYVIVATTMQAMIVGSFNTTTVYSSTPLFFPVTMRTQPTITYTGTTFLNDGIGNSISSTIDAWNSFVWGTTPNTITASGLTTGKYYFLSLGGAGNYFRASAEL
jgi:hypothetical protein